MGVYGGTCGNVCSDCNPGSSCSSPGIESYSGAPGSSISISSTVMWTCINQPVPSPVRSPAVKPSASLLVAMPSYGSPLAHSPLAVIPVLSPVTTPVSDPFAVNVCQTGLDATSSSQWVVCAVINFIKIFLYFMVCFNLF